MFTTDPGTRWDVHVYAYVDEDDDLLYSSGDTEIRIDSTTISENDLLEVDYEDFTLVS